MGCCVSDENGATKVQDLRAPLPTDAEAMLHLEGTTPFPIDSPASWRIGERRRSSNNSIAERRRSSNNSIGQGERRRSSQNSVATPNDRRAEKRLSLSNSKKSTTTFQSTVDALWSSSYCTNRESQASSMDVTSGSYNPHEEQQGHIEVNPEPIVCDARPEHPASSMRRSTASNVLVPLSQFGSESSSCASEVGVAVVHTVEDLTF